MEDVGSAYGAEPEPESRTFIADTDVLDRVAENPVGRREARQCRKHAAGAALAREAMANAYPERFSVHFDAQLAAATRSRPSLHRVPPATDATRFAEPILSPQPSGDLMRTVPIGTRGSFDMVVSPQHLANRFKDATLPAVLATPVMIMAMENAALNAIKPYLEPGESAVGTSVDVRHLAATPVGRQIVAFAEVTGVSGRHLEFRVKAMDGAEEIGLGTHGRVVIDLSKFSEHLAREAAKREH
jgi:fluoroacetyl-CoA thioesterase